MQAVQSQELKWHTNVKEAIAIGNKSTSLDDVFTGSDWCGWCIRLQKEVIDLNLQRAAGNVILVS
jgi:protein disulfide-isomerase